MIPLMNRFCPPTHPKKEKKISEQLLKEPFLSKFEEHFNNPKILFYKAPFVEWQGSMNVKGSFCHRCQ